MRQMYVFVGIDKQKTIESAAKTTKTDQDQVIVHLHGKPRKCQDYQHVMYEKGVLVDGWGTVDGSSLAPNIQGQ